MRNVPSPGDSAVGKSSLVLRFVKGQFHEYQESTIGGMLKDGRSCALRMRALKCRLCEGPGRLAHTEAAFLTQTVVLDDTTVKFEIWDTAGQEHIRLRA